MKTSLSNTMEIESMIYVLASRGQGRVKPYDMKIVENISWQSTFNSLGMTEKQAYLMMKILKRYADVLNELYKQDVSPWLQNPVYRYPLRVSLTQQKISFIGDNDPFKKIKIEFPYNEEILTLLRREKVDCFFSEWNPTEKCWYFSFDPHSLRLCMALVNTYKFDCDPEILVYFDQISEAQENLEKYVPILDFREGKFYFSNTPFNIPDLESDDLLENLFYARKYGVSVWSDSVVKKITESQTSKLILDFLKHTESKEFLVDLDNFDQDSLKKLVKYLFPCVIFIPAGNELSKTKYVVNLLSDVGTNNSEISVLFRLPNEKDSAFNQFVKENQLNSPISQKTKAVLLSQKIPKTILSCGIKFNSVILFSKLNPHYQAKAYIKEFQNVIEISEKNHKKITENSRDWLLDV